MRHRKAFAAARGVLGSRQRRGEAQQTKDESNDAQHGVSNRTFLATISVAPNSQAVMAAIAHVWAEAVRLVDSEL